MTPSEPSYREILLTRGQVAKISPHRFDEVNKFRWQAHWREETQNFYAGRTIHLPNGKRTTISMHRFIMGLSYGDKRTVDHIIPGDTLNNTDSNLRIADRRGQTQNQRKHRGTNSSLKGICYVPDERKWYAQIRISGKSKYLGSFNTAEEAHTVYVDAAKKIHGEFFNENVNSIIEPKDKGVPYANPPRWRTVPVVNLRCVNCEELFSWHIDGWQLSKLGPPATCSASCRSKAAWKTKGVTWDASTWQSWHDMMRRCYNPKRKEYKNYGARGISVCERWHSIENFVADMGLKPMFLSLDRINNDGNYEPGNVRWANFSEQLNNQQRTKKYLPNRKSMSWMERET